MNDLRSFTSTLCQLLDIKKPNLSVDTVFEELTLQQSTKKKALIYCPDAFGLHALNKYPHLYQRLVKNSTHEVELKSIYPPVTPVCFASLFTGALPSQHGIESYRKPVLQCQTIFDVLVQANKKVALVAVKNSSVDTIFKERPIDYFSLDYDPLVTAKALQLIQQNQHDVIIVYHQEYDDLLHETGPFSVTSQWALNRHVDTYELLAEHVAKYWKRDYVVAFTPDHGGHTDKTTGLGDHGVDSDEDMNLKHFYILK